MYQVRRREEYIELVRLKIEKGEKSGFSTKTKDELLAEFKRQLI